jgi:hypothetical protein
MHRGKGWHREVHRRGTHGGSKDLRIRFSFLGDFPRPITFHFPIDSAAEVSLDPNTSIVQEHVGFIHPFCENLVCSCTEVCTEVAF